VPVRPPIPVVERDSGFDPITVKNNRALTKSPRQPEHTRSVGATEMRGSVKFEKIANFKIYFVRL